MLIRTILPLLIASNMSNLFSVHENIRASEAFEITPQSRAAICCLVSANDLSKNCSRKKRCETRVELIDVRPVALAVLHHVEEGVDGRIRNDEQQPCEEFENQPLPLGEIGTQQRPEKILVETDRGVVDAFAIAGAVSPASALRRARTC